MQRHAELFASCLLLFFTIGCGSSFTATNGTSTDSTPGIALTGTVFGGRQPINGAHIYLMSVGTAGYGSAATSLLTKGDGTDTVGTYVLTSSTGSFNLTGDYTCTGGAEVYVLSEGGDPGDGINSAAVLVDLLGACPGTAGSTGNNFSTIPGISINEITTVAAGYALAPFVTDGAHVGSTSTNAAGIATAFNTGLQLVNPYYGYPYLTTPTVSGYTTSGLSGNGTAPANRVNLIANALAACVNSTGPTSHNCSVLFANSISPTGTTPADIFTAAANLAQNPSATAATNIFNMIPPTPPYTTNINTAPPDLTLSIAYTAPNTSTPTRAAFDGSGNLWFPNYGNNSLTELSPTGVVYSGTGGFTGSSLNQPWGLAVSPTSGKVLVANNAGNYASVFLANGTASTAVSLTGPSYSVAYDSYGTAYAATGTGVQSYTLGGLLSALLTTGTTTYGVALTSAGSIWSTSIGASLLNNKPLLFNKTYSGGGLSAPTAMSVDGSNNLWVANSSSNTISEFNSSGTAISSSSGYTGGGVNSPWAISVDGDGKVFVANYTGTISKFTSAGVAMSPAPTAGNSSTTPVIPPTPGGYATGATGANVYSYSVAIDNAGNVWSPNANGIIYQFVGLAAPVSIPMSNTTAGVRP